MFPVDYKFTWILSVLQDTCTVSPNECQNTFKQKNSIKHLHVHVQCTCMSRLLIKINARVLIRENMVDRIYNSEADVTYMYMYMYSCTCILQIKIVNNWTCGMVFCLYLDYVMINKQKRCNWIANDSMYKHDWFIINVYSTCMCMIMYHLWVTLDCAC